jgi:MFS transporter, DHA1 family, solute carrier family 18 (vesicular amine transporter), member 1/2
VRGRGAAAPCGRDRTRRGVIRGIAIGAVTIDAALLGLIAPLLPQIEERTGASDAALGIALAAYAAPIALLSLPLGRAADRFGRRVLLIAGLLVIAAGSVLIAVSHSLELLIAARTIQGIGSAASWISALALVSDTAPPGRRGESLGAALAATGIGSIAGPALGGVTADVLSYEAPFLIACGCALAVVGAALMLLPHGVRPSRPAAPALAVVLRSIRAGDGGWAAAITLLSATVLGLVEVVAPLDFDQRLGLSASAIGLLFAGSIAVDAATSPLGGRWGDRRGRLGPAVAGMVLTAISVGLLAVLPDVWGAALSLGVYGAAFALAFSAAVPWLDDAFEEEERGLGYGVQALLYSAGYAVGPVLGGWLLERTGADLAYAITAGVVAVGAVFLLVRRPEA